MKIGAVAKAAGIGIDAVRFYERRGLIPAPARQPSDAEYRLKRAEILNGLRENPGSP